LFHIIYSYQSDTKLIRENKVKYICNSLTWIRNLRTCNVK